MPLNKLKKASTLLTNNRFTKGMHKGNELLQNGHLELAEKHFEDMLSHMPDNLEILRTLVRISTDRRDRLKTLEHLKRILTIEPDALYERAFYAFRQEWRNFDETRNSIDKLISIAENQTLTAESADVVIHVIQYFATSSQRITSLAKVKSLLQKTIRDSPDTCLPEKVTVAELSLMLEDYNDLDKAIAQLRTEGNFDSLKWRVAPLMSAADKIASPNFPDYSAEKVFGIGLSRTGTSSLNAALKRLGYNAVHWASPLTRDLIHQEDFVLFDAFTDICISHQFEWLYHTFPNSKFILTTRPIESWVKSVNDHYISQHDTSGPRALSDSGAKRRYRNRGGQIEANLYAQHETWADAYTHFNDRVHAFFKDKPKDRFLEMSIIGGQGWESLCPFLEKPVPVQGFPNLNPNLRRP